MAELHSLAEHRRYGGTLKHVQGAACLGDNEWCYTAVFNGCTKCPDTKEAAKWEKPSPSEKSTEQGDREAADKHIIMCHRCEKRTHHSTSVAIEKPLVTTVVRQLGHLKAACRSKLNKKQHLEWHVKEESSQDELQLLVKSTFIPYGRCTCSLKIDSSRFCSRHWFMADIKGILK